MQIRLEPLARMHLARVEAMLGDEEVQRFTRLPAKPPRGFVETWHARYETGRADGTREAFAIVDGDGAFLGVALAPVIDREAATAELGYMVAPAARGRGAATEALRLITDWAFAQGIERVELRITVDNAASRRVAERCGYTLEGVLRSVWLKPGTRADTEVWSRLATDR